MRLTKAPSHSSLIDAERRKKKATKKKEGEHVFLCRIFFWNETEMMTADGWRAERPPPDLTFAEQIMCVRRIGLVYVCMYVSARLNTGAYPDPSLAIPTSRRAAVTDIRPNNNDTTIHITSFLQYPIPNNPIHTRSDCAPKDGSSPVVHEFVNENPHVYCLLYLLELVYKSAPL